MNPCEYGRPVLKGKSLQDQGHIRSFANYLRKKMSDMTFNPLPESPEDMILAFNNGPLPDLYNICYNVSRSI